MKVLNHILGFGNSKQMYSLQRTRELGKDFILQMVRVETSPDFANNNLFTNHNLCFTTISLLVYGIIDN